MSLFSQYRLSPFGLKVYQGVAEIRQNEAFSAHLDRVWGISGISSVSAP